MQGRDQDHLTTAPATAGLPEGTSATEGHLGRGW